MGKSNNGKRFEDNFKKSVERAGYYFERMIDSNKFGFGGNTRFTSKSPFDCLFFNGDNLYLVELKSTVNTSFSFNQPVLQKPQKDSKMIKYHQIKSLSERAVYDNVVPVLILDFADRTTAKGVEVHGGTYAIHINDFIEWASHASMNKSSINLYDARQIGIEVPRVKKKVNYTYDVESLKGLVKGG